MKKPSIATICKETKIEGRQILGASEACDSIVDPDHAVSSRGTICLHCCGVMNSIHITTLHHHTPRPTTPCTPHRYESTIAGLFYGHTHKDHFMMVYDPENATRAVHVGYVTQSQTPYHELNPGYRVFTVDGDYEGSSYVSVITITMIVDNGDKLFIKVAAYTN